MVTLLVQDLLHHIEAVVSLHSVDTFCLFWLLSMKILIYCTHCSTSLSKTLCFSSCLFKGSLQSALIGQLTQAWPNATDNNRAAVLGQFSRAKVDAVDVNYANMCHGDVVWCHKVTLTTDDVLQCFLAERGASVNFLRIRIFYRH